MCDESPLRLIDFVHHSTLGLRVIKKRNKYPRNALASHCVGTGRFRAKREQLKRCQGLLSESQGQNLVVTVLYVPYSRSSSKHARTQAALSASIKSVHKTDLMRPGAC